MKKKIHKPRQKMYGIVKKTENGYLGFCDDTVMSMGWRENAICLWKKVPLHYYNGQCITDENIFVIRAHSKKCPINIKMNEPCYRKNKGNYYFEIREELK
jgi:hypothetical protein